MSIRILLLVEEGREITMHLGGFEAVIVYCILLVIAQRWVKTIDYQEGCVVHNVWLYGPQERTRHRIPTARMLHIGPRF
ncbi:hypothetical protein FSST1_012298 [Fusarium sambucinum]